MVYYSDFVYNINKKIQLIKKNTIIDNYRILLDCEKRIDDLYFMSDVIKNKIKKDIDNCIFIKYSNIEMKIFYKDKDEHFKNKYIELLKLIKTISMFFNFTDKIDVTLYYCDCKKLISLDKDFIGINEVNSGCTIRKKGYSKMHVWRNEELKKVIVHELIHYMKKDVIETSELKNYMNKLNIIGEKRSPEAYVEFLAELLIILYSFENYENVIEQLNKEYIHSMIQAKKIINFFRNMKKQIKQKTSVFSYYILKAAYFNNFKEIIKYIEKNINLNNDNEIKKEEYKILVRNSLNDNFYKNLFETKVVFENNILSLRMMNYNNDFK